MSLHSNDLRRQLQLAPDPLRSRTPRYVLLKALDDDLLAGVGCEQPVDGQITGLIDALHYRADMGLEGRLRYCVGRRDDGKSEKAVQALHTLAGACRAPVEIRLDEDATRPEPADFSGVGEDWHRRMANETGSWRAPQSQSPSCLTGAANPVSLGSVG